MTETLDILMVDDQPEMFTAIERCLGGDMFSFRKYTSEADVAGCELGNVPVCILDLFFEKVMRGQHLIELVSRKWPTAPIILLTNYPSRFDLIDLSRIVKLSRIVDSIAKPEFLLHESILRAAVAKAVEQLYKNTSDFVLRVRQHFRYRDLEDEAPTVSEIVVGDVVYPLVGDIRVVCTAHSYSLDGLEPFVVGSGDSVDEARRMFTAKLHDAFQSLLQTRPRFRTTDEEAKWDALCRIINLDEFDRLRPVVVPHEIGLVAEVKPTGDRTIKWHGGLTTTVSLRDVPELAALEKGTWVKAVVARRRTSRNKGRIIHITGLATPPKFTEQQRREFWNQTPDTDAADE